MKQFLSCLFIILVCFSCTKFEEEYQCEEMLPETRTGMALSNGNPYSFKNIQSAANQIAVFEGTTPIRLTPTHLYVRFFVQDTVQYCMLSDSMRLSLYPYPLDRRLSSGEMHQYLTNQHNQYFYSVLPIKNLSILSSVQCNILDTLYMQPTNSLLRTNSMENEEEMMDGNTDESSGVENGLYRTSATAVQLSEAGWEKVLKQAKKNVGIELPTGPSSTASGDWYPSVRVTYQDDKLTDPIPLPGVKVVVRDFTNEGFAYTGTDGIARDIAANSGRWFTDYVQYVLRFENDQGGTEWIIRDCGYLTAEYHNEDMMNTNWNLFINARKNDTPHRLQCFAATHLGTYAFIMGQNVLNKNFKNFDHLMVIGVFPEETCIEHPGAGGWFIWDERLNRLSKRTDIKIYGRVKANEYVSKAAMVASTIHEFGHASHFQSVLSTPGSDRNKNYKRAENKMVESYAVTVEYYISSLIYGRTKAGDLLQHGSHPDYTKVGPSLICNGVTVEDLQNTVIYSATFAEWMQKIWEVPRVQDKLDRSVFDLILDNPYRLILDNYNEMLKGPEHTSVGVKNDYYIDSRYVGDVEVLSFEISGEGYNIESDAKQEHFYVTFSTRGKRTITLTVNHLKLNAVLRAVMEVDVADPPEIIACALSSTQPRIGDRNCYTIKNYPNTVIPYWSIGRYENRQFVDYSSHFFILDAPSEEYFYIVPKFGGKYVIQAKLSIGMGKYETLELEINVPTETVRMPGVVTPWPNDSTYITRVRAYLKNNGTAQKRIIYNAGPFYSISSDTLGGSYDFYAFCNLPFENHPNYSYIVPLYENKYQNNQFAYDTKIYSEWGNTANDTPVLCYIYSGVRPGAVPLYSIEEVRLENNVIVNAFRYVSTADKPNQQYTSTDPVTKKAYTLKTINHGRIGYVYPNSEL